jgi:DNA-binding response OmpR family regulator
MSNAIIILWHLTYKFMPKITILIIEDEKPLLETLKFKLNKEGFKVEAVADGTMALEKVKQVKPDLVLLDLVLPNVPGQKILEKIKKNNDLKETPVIIISNSGQPVEIKQLLALGADDYIIKADFTIDDILERVYNTLEKKNGQPDVLIAEDETFLRMVLAKKLRLAGLRIISAVDGETSLKSVLEFKPKVLILDLLMPGMDGVEILHTLNKSSDFDPSQTKIIILSNYSGKENEPIIKKMTQGYYIKSNLDIDEVVGKIKGLLE